MADNPPSGTTPFPTPDQPSPAGPKLHPLISGNYVQAGFAQPIYPEDGLPPSGPPDAVLVPALYIPKAATVAQQAEKALALNSEFAPIMQARKVHIGMTGKPYLPIFKEASGGEGASIFHPGDHPTNPGGNRYKWYWRNDTDKVLYGFLT